MESERSPLFYVGDKYQILDEIKQYFPSKIKRFIEPFTGGGSVFLNVQAEKYLLNDIDENICSLHKFLISQADNPDKFFKEVNKIIAKYNLSRSYKEDIVPSRLKKRWKKTYYAKYNKIGYEKLRSDFNMSKKKKPLHLYLLLIYGFNRMIRFNSAGEFNVPVGNVDFNKNVYEALKSYFTFVKNKDIKWHNLNFAEFIESISFTKDDFIYLDPPYLISTSEYNKLWNEMREKELLSLLDELNTDNIRFAVSNVVSYRGTKNTIFAGWMGKFNVFKVESNYISYHNNKQKAIKEVLVTNY